MSGEQLGWFDRLEWTDDNRTTDGSFLIEVYRRPREPTWYALRSVGHDWRVHDLNPTHRRALHELGIGNMYAGRTGMAKARAAAQAIVDHLAGRT